MSTLEVLGLVYLFQRRLYADMMVILASRVYGVKAQLSVSG